MEVYLEVDEDNVDALQELGFDIEVDDELDCEALYDIDYADPSVGIKTSSCNVHTVECNGIDVSRFFCIKDLCEQADEFEVDALEDAKCKAAEARWEQMRELL